MNQRRKFWMRWRVRAGYPVAAAFWLFAAPSRHSLVVGGIVAGFGLFIRGVASGYLRKDQELAVGGPYARTRNPLYLGSALIAAGFVLVGRSWWAGGLVAVYFATFYYAVMRNEEQDLRVRFGEVYESYAARVPFFFPALTVRKEVEVPSDKEAPVFSFQQFHRNREYRALIGTIAGLAVMWLRIWIRARFGY
jgi:protein-S-isoprenylcysteine O-methyltransferase Ste14